MASPPAKRQRRSRAVFSDDEDEELGTLRQPLTADPANSFGTSNPIQSTFTQKSTQAVASKSKSKPSTNASKTTPRKAAPKPRATPSPNKAKKPSKSKPKEEDSKSLHSFFGRASEEQRWNRKVDTPVEEVESGENGDAIEDDDSLDEAFLGLTEDHNDTKLVLDRRKEGTYSIKNELHATQPSFPVPTQKFVKPPIPSIKQVFGQPKPDQEANEELHRPWADKYGPINLDELAVHKKKVADVQKWLGDVLYGRNPSKILVLKGPAGSGKSTTVSLLSKALKFQISHWSNPTVSDSGMLASVASQFDDYINRSGQFDSLEFGDSTSAHSGAKSGEAVEALLRVLVVEEFPSTITRSSNALESFRGVLLRHLATDSTGQHAMFGKSRSSLNTHSPIVMIVSESLLTSATASADSFTAHRLLGPEISNHPLVTIMEFNSVAFTIVGKALELVIKKEARDSQRRRIPGPAVIRRLSAMGDIRSAVNTLEFLCARSGDNEDWSGRVAAKMKRSDRDGITLTAMEKNSLEMVTQREATLGMFHAVGKVVYNKRKDPAMIEPGAEPPPKPPDHLVHLHKPQVSEVSVDDLMNETGTDIPTFISTLHENYLLSCNGSTFLESFDDCIRSLSDSDILAPESRPMSRASYGAAGSGKGLSHAGGLDVLRQNEISFHVAVRGMLFALPCPVRRAALPGGRSGDNFKMFYPASLRLWKPMEETDGLISLFMEQATLVSPLGAKLAGKADAGVASWKQKNNTFNVNSLDQTDPEIPRIIVSRADMLFDRLPYLSKVQDKKDLDLRKVRQVTQFRGASLPDESVSDEGATESAIDLSAADETTDVIASPKTKDRIMRLGNDQGRAQHAAPNLSFNKEVPLEKLYISDDDIQDE